MGSATASIETLLSVARFSRSVEQYLSMVGGRGEPVEESDSSEHAAGVRAVQAAGRALRVSEQKELLRDARSHFHKAQGVEQGLRLAHALLGFALCQRHLGEEHQAKLALSDLLKVTPSEPDLQTRRTHVEEPAAAGVDEGLTEFRALLDFISAEKERLAGTWDKQQEVIEELEHFATRVRRKGPTLFLQQLIAEKKKMLISKEKERRAIEELLRLCNEILRGGPAGARAQQPTGEQEESGAKRLEVLQAAVKAYLESRAKMTYSP